MQRGTSGVFLIEGTGLAGASEIVFSEPGLVGKILEVGEVPESRLALETKVTVVAKPYFEDPVKMQAEGRDQSRGLDGYRNSSLPDHYSARQFDSGTAGRINVSGTRRARPK